MAANTDQLLPAAVMDEESAGVAELDCWCGSGEWQTCFRTRRFGVLYCGKCRTYRIDPPPLAKDASAEDFYTDYYAQRPEEDAAAEVRRSARDSKFWQICARVPELREPWIKALDIGCGDGGLCAELKDAGCESVAGIEASRARIARARRVYPDIDFYCGTLDETPLAKGSLDLVAMDSVIEHLPDPLGVLKQIRSYTAKSGQIVLLTPNMDSGHYRVLGRRWTGMLAPHVHMFLFNPASLSHLLEQAGFKVQAAGSLHMAPYRASQWIKWMARGEFKDVAWRAYHELGGLYGRIIGSGPLLYVVARNN